jgi:hypothetical protein
MSFTELLDELSQVGPRLAASPAELQDSAAFDARNEVNAALLPVWQWLDGLKDAADQNKVDWVELDGAPSDESIEAVRSAIAFLSAEIDSGNVATLRSELTVLGSLLLTVAEETDARLSQLGVEAERRNRLLLPLRAHISELAVTRGSSEALSLARQSLGQAGEKRLSEGVESQVDYERIRADRFRYATLVAFVVSIGWLIASYVAFRSPVSAGSERITQAVTRLAIGSAVLALALYLSREAGDHRSRASGWRSVQLQMDTIDLYCASLPPEHRDAIRLAFGLEVFSGSKLFGSLGQVAGGNASNGSGLPAAIELDRALALVRMLQGRGGSS